MFVCLLHRINSLYPEFNLAQPVDLLVDPVVDLQVGLQLVEQQRQALVQQLVNHFAFV